MFSVNTQKKMQNQCKNVDGEGKVVGLSYYEGSSGENLRNWVEKASMLATQEIEGHWNPFEIHGGSVVAKKAEERRKEMEVMKMQMLPPNVKPSLRLLATGFKPRLKWTTELHACFLDALNQLGGPDKATPKRLQDAMGIEGLELSHIKSHLQKYRSWKAMGREWPQVPKIPGSSICTSTRYQTLRAYEYNKFKNKCQDQGNNVKKIYEMDKDSWKLLFEAVQNRKIPDAMIQAASKKPFHQHYKEADATDMSQQDLDGLMTTPSSSHGTPEAIDPKINTPDKLEEFASFELKTSRAASSQSQKVAHSAIAGFINSQGGSFPCNITDAINVQVLLQDEVHTAQAQAVTDGLQSQDTVYSATSDFPDPIFNYSENMSYLQAFLPLSASFSFEPQNTYYDYQPPNAAFNFLTQNASYDYYQPQSVGNVNQLQDAVFECLPQAAAAYGHQPQNAGYSAPSNLPTSKGKFSETEYLDDMNETLAATGNTSMEAINFDPVEAYMVWDDPEPKFISFTEMREQSGQMESSATPKKRTS